MFFKTNSPPWLANKDSEVRSDLMHGDVRGGAIFFIEKSSTMVKSLVNQLPSCATPVLNDLRGRAFSPSRDVCGVPVYICALGSDQ
jgi:hypothetical protein